MSTNYPTYGKRSINYKGEGVVKDLEVEISVT